MSRSTCRFCAHANPEGARFCNACGSQIDLKPCRQCDAINRADAIECHLCGSPLGESSLVAAEPDTASASGDATPFPRASIPELFARSNVTIPEPERVVALPVVPASGRRHDLAGRTRRRGAQAAALLVLGLTIVAGAFWMRGSSVVPEDRIEQRGVIARSASPISDAPQPAYLMPTDPSPRQAAVQVDSGPAPPSPGVNDEAVDTTSPLAAREERAASPSTEEAPSQAATAVNATSQPPRAARKSVTSTPSTATRKAYAAREYDAPASPRPWPAPAPSGQRACTQALAALSLCDSPGDR